MNMKLFVLQSYCSSFHQNIYFKTSLISFNFIFNDKLNMQVLYLYRKTYVPFNFKDDHQFV